MEPLVFLFIFSGIGAGITYHNFLHYKGLLMGIMPFLEDPQVIGIVAPRLVGRYRGFSLSLTVLPGGRNSPPGITICLYTATSFQLHIYGERTLQKLGKKLGLLDEIEIGVRDFDDKYVIQTASASRARAYLSDRATRNDIEFLFTSGYHDFKVADGALQIEKRSQDMAGDLDPMSMKAAFEDLVRLARQL